MLAEPILPSSLLKRVEIICQRTDYDELLPTEHPLVTRRAKSLHVLHPPSDLHALLEPSLLSLGGDFERLGALVHDGLDDVDKVLAHGVESLGVGDGDGCLERKQS